MTAIPGIKAPRVYKPEVRVYKPRFVRLCCERTTFSIANSASYKAKRIAIMRRCCDPAADILGGIDAIVGVEFVTIDNGNVTVGFCNNVNVEAVDAQIRKVLERHPGI